MNINWKLRIKNKTTLIALIGAFAAFVYQVLGWFNIVPPVTQGEFESAAAILVNILVMLGVVVDPTTQGVSDSDAAQKYAEPRAPGTSTDKSNI